MLRSPRRFTQNEHTYGNTVITLTLRSYQGNGIFLVFYMFIVCFYFIVSRYIFNISVSYTYIIHALNYLLVFCMCPIMTIFSQHFFLFSYFCPDFLLCDSGSFSTLFSSLFAFSIRLLNSSQDPKKKEMGVTS